MDRMEETVMKLLEAKQYRQLKSLLDEENPMDIAEVLDELPSEQAVTVFRLLSKEKATDVFAAISTDHHESIINSVTDAELGHIVNELFIDDAVDIIEELPAGVVRRVLQNASPETRLVINRFLQYPEDSAGSIMTTEYIALKKHMSVRQCFTYIREHALDSETIYTCFVTDAERRLEGVLTVKDLFLNSDETVIDKIMDDRVILAHTHDDREEVVDKMNKYDLLSLPVVDNEERLVGIVTIDDALDVMEEEATEDFEKMYAMTPSEAPYMKTGVWVLAKNRILWLTLLMLSDIVAGTILRNYEHAFSAIPLLVSFMPMLIDTGGNAGSQSATMVIRGMAIGEVSLGDFFRVIWKEFQVGLMAGLVLGVVNFIRLMIMYPGKTMIIFTIVLSIYIIVILSKIIGGILPMLAKALRMDPAIMAAPMITTVIDALGLIIYFQLATHLLNL